jgi:hypothetical protein
MGPFWKRFLSALWLATEGDLEPEPTVEARPRARRPECDLEAIYAGEG